MLKLWPLLFLLLASGCAHKPGQGAAISPNEVESRMNLAKMYLVEAEPRSALEQLRIIEHQAKNNPRLHFFLGAAYELLNNHEQSAKAYERAVALDPAFGDAWNNLGQVRKAMGEFEAACSAFKQALAIKEYMTPEFAAYNMASLFAEQGKFDQALAYSKLGMEKNSRYIPLYPQSAELLRMTSRANEAVEILRRGILARPESIKLRLMLAKELLRLGREQEARKWFLQTIEQDPESDEAETAAHYLEVLR